MLAGLVSVFAGHLIETVKLKAMAAALYAAAGGALLFALIFGLVGLRHWLVVTYALQYPDLWIALGFLVITAVLVGIGYSISLQKPKTNPAADLALIAGPPVLKLVARNSNARLAAVGVVLVAGLFAGRRMTSRRKS